MALKKSLQSPPSASASSNDEQNSSSEGERYSSHEDDGEENQPQAKTYPKGQSTKLPANMSDSESDSGSETGSDSKTESEPENQPPPQPYVKKPAAAKPNQETQKKSKSKSLASVSATAGKRGNATNVDGNNSKRAKKSDYGVGEKSVDSKKLLFQRLFSEDDEVTLLEGLIEFSLTNGFNPTKDMNAFHDCIKKSMKCDASLAQLKDKLGRLRKKFMNNLKRGKDGETKALSNAHEQKTFDLSKQIWGSEFSGNGAELSVKPNGKAKNTQEKNKRLAALKLDLGLDESKEKEAGKITGMEIDRETKSSGNFNMDVIGDIEDFVLRRGLDVIDGAKKAKMEEKWRKLRVAELELFLQRNELIHEQAQLLLDFYKR